MDHRSIATLLIERKVGVRIIISIDCGIKDIDKAKTLLSVVKKVCFKLIQAKQANVPEELHKRL